MHDQNKYNYAESLLLEGCQGMKEREATILPQTRIRLTEALERLVKLYKATDNKEEAANWQAEIGSQRQ